MQQIYSENPPPFHMYNLAKLDECSELHQIPKVDLFAITAFNGLKSLTVFTKSCFLRCLTALWIHLCKMLRITNILFKRKFHSHLHTLHLYFGPGHVLMNFLNSNNKVVDLIYSGNMFHMFAPKALKPLFPSFVVFLVWMYGLCFLWVTFGDYEINLS